MNIKETPMMGQYLQFKKQYKDKIVLFRMGDFFETFGDDAKLASKILNITLTTRDKNTNPTPLAGFPHKALDQYLPKIINAGYSAVIVDQLEDPRFAKGIVKRGVTRIVTPGTVDGDIANEIKNTYLGTFVRDSKNFCITLCDVSTGELIYILDIYTKNILENILSTYQPVEILVSEDEKEFPFSNIPIHFVTKAFKNIKYSEEVLKEFFNIKSTNPLGIQSDISLISLAMSIKYIQETQLMDPKHIQKPRRVNINGKMILDRSTIHNLELISNSYTGDIKGSLFEVLDNTCTPMGKRLLYSWILNPLIQKKEIEYRLGIVDKIFKNKEGIDELRDIFSNINDIERLVGKLGLNRISAKEVKALQYSLEYILDISKKLEEYKLDISLERYEKDIREIIKNIDDCIVENPPILITEGHIIKDTYNDEIKELRELTGDSKSWIRNFEEKEKEQTGINNLKISFNKVFGYYIEVTKAQQAKVPDRYIRKQTLVNCERYITEELKEKESIILNAEDKLFSLEYKIFDEFRNSLIKYIPTLQSISKDISKLDVLIGFAYLSIQSNYVRPNIYDIGEKDGILNIKGGRHPIVERSIEEEYISNDTYLDNGQSNMSILTGPNMSGKSTYIRQVATITLMAQIGSYIPAKKGDISITDRIFTRVGASDDLSRGRSTFMVEMDEAANIINNATKYSLVILDEIGRGTSTYDGVSIAWALAEYLVNDIKCRTIFATHYHELLKLAEKNPNKVKNFNVLVEEDMDSGNVIFLRKIVEGGTDRSYGIYVAKMAGLPNKVIKRANEILESFEQEKMFNKESHIRESEIINNKGSNKIQSVYQYPLFLSKDSEIEKDIQKLNIDNLTPIEALNMIASWKKKL